MKGAAYYDEVYRGTYHVDHERVQLLAGLCKGSVLDVGCGDGVLGRYYGGPYLGLDFSEVAIGLANRDCPDKKFACCDFLNGPLPKGDWDTVVMGEVLEHLTGKAQEALFVKLQGAIRNGAAVLVSVPNGDAIPDPAHLQTFGASSLEHTLQRFGSVRVREHGKYLMAYACPTRPKLSVALIVKDEEELLPRCLESLKGLGDELVVVDTGSTDRTVEIAESYGARIGHFPWRDDFAAARNYAEGLCAGEYIYWQDADEILIEGQDIIREIVEEGKKDGVRPKLIFSRDANGKPDAVFCRQELLHKNIPGWKWQGAAHNYLTGLANTVEPRIVVEHLQRSAGDRPNFKDMFDALRVNLASGFHERHLFYLLRQHWYDKHYQEAIALSDMLLAQQPPGWRIQRSQAALIAGLSYVALKQTGKARAAYIRALWEWGRWAEPYFRLGELHYREREWPEAIAWLSASCAFEPPGDYFTDLSIYQWRRYDLLAVCLSKLGRNEEAERYGTMALSVRPDDKRLQRNQEHYGESRC